MIRRFFITSALLSIFALAFPQYDLPVDLRISLLTSEPCNNEVYTAWGHTAIRVSSKSAGNDIVFNYGLFSFNEDFVPKFVKGETDYRLGVCDFSNALNEVVYEKNVDYYEQVLNLTFQEKQKMFSLLMKNLEPENRVYRYNFFYDNCATRPRDIIEKCVDGKVRYSEVGEKVTYRDLIHAHLCQMPWFSFGIDICLGSETDEVVSERNLQFLPHKLMQTFEGAVIESDGNVRNLVAETVCLHKRKDVVLDGTIFSFLTPNIVFWIFFILVLLHSYFYYYRWKKNDDWFDAFFFFLLGLLGCLVFFLSFISEHPCTNPNYNLMWLNPLLVIFSVFAIFFKYSKLAMGIIYLNMILIPISIIVWLFSVQEFNPAFLPLMLSSEIRSIIYLKKRGVNVKFFGKTMI